MAHEICGQALVADLFDNQNARVLLGCAEALAGPIDILVNNAGMETTKSIFDTSEEEVDEVMQLNLRVPIQLSRLALISMKTRNTGHIVNISSMAANGGFAGMSVYAATKAGLSHFTPIVRQDVKGTDIKVTNVEVSPVPTDLLANLTHDPAVRAVEKESRAVWLPRRAFLFGAPAGAPQRIAEQFLRNIKS